MRHVINCTKGFQTSFNESDHRFSLYQLKTKGQSISSMKSFEPVHVFECHSYEISLHETWTFIWGIQPLSFDRSLRNFCFGDEKFILIYLIFVFPFCLWQCVHRRQRRWQRHRRRWPRQWRQRRRLKQWQQRRQRQRDGLECVRLKIVNDKNKHLSLWNKRRLQ